jgi:PDZ domain
MAGVISSEKTCTDFTVSRDTQERHTETQAGVVTPPKSENDVRNGSTEKDANGNLPVKTPEPTQGAISNRAQSGSGKGQNGIASLGLTVTNSENGGAQIVKIASASPAEIAGLHVGDVLWSVDGKRIGSVPELEATLGDRISGSTVRVQYLFHTNLGWMPGSEKVLTFKADGK